MGIDKVEGKRWLRSSKEGCLSNYYSFSKAISFFRYNLYYLSTIRPSYSMNPYTGTKSFFQEPRSSQSRKKMEILSYNNDHIIEKTFKVGDKL
jgi:hypothetical protein